MAEGVFKIRIEKDDAALKELAAQLSSVFGGATAEKVKASSKALYDGVTQSAKRASQEQAEAAKSTADKIAATIGTIVGKAEAAHAREVESAQAADERLAALAAKEETRKQQQQQKLQERAAQAEARAQAAEQKRVEAAIRAGDKISAKDEERRAKEAQRDAEFQAKREQQSKQKAQQEESKAQQAQAKQAARDAASSAKFEEGEKRKAAAGENASKKLEEITANRERFEKQAESLKFDELKEHYKQLVTASQNAATAMEAAATKEDKAELKSKLDMLKQEKQAYADTLRERPETKKGKSSDVGMLGTKREVSASGGGLLQIAGIGAAIEGLKMLTEKSDEAAAAQKQLIAGTGATGKMLEEDSKMAEALGNKYKMSGDAAETTMGKVAAATGAVGPELSKQTEAVIAYASAHGKSSEAVAKLMSTEAGRAKIFNESQVNMAKAQEAANTPAAKAQFIQTKLMETVSKLAMTVLNALSPVMDALLPIITDLGDLIGTLLKPALDALMPLLTALTPLLQLVGTLAGQLLTPVLNVLSGIIKFLVDKAIAPLVQWLGVKVPEAVQKMIGFIKGAIDAVKGAFNAVTSFLGLGDKAAAATKDAGAKVKEQDQQNAEELARQKTIQAGQARIAEENSLKAKLAHNKLSAAEEAKLRSAAEDDQDDATLAKLDAFDKKKEAQAAKSGKAGAKARADAAKTAADQELAGRKDEIAAMDITDRQAKALTVAAELKHSEDILAVQKQFFGEKSKEYISAQHQAQALRITDKKQERADQLADAKSATDNLLAELSIRADKEEMTAKQRADAEYKINLDGLTAQLALVQKGSDEESKLLQQRAAMTAKHDSDLIVIRRKLQEEADADNIALTKQHLAQTVEMLNAQGVSTKGLEHELTQISIDEENERYKKELETRKDDLSDEKQGFALSEALKKQHEAALTKIKTDEAAKRLQSQRNEVAYFAGPFIQGMNKGINMLMSGVKKMTDGWAQSKNAGLAIFGTIASAFVDMVEKMAAEALAKIAVFELLNALTGGGAGALGSVASLVGLSEGGIISKPTVLAAGIISKPTFLASGGVMPIIGGEAGPEAVIPLSSSRAQSQIGNAFGFDKALGPVVDRLDAIHAATSNPRTVLPMNNVFETQRNNYVKSEQRRSF